MPETEIYETAAGRVVIGPMEERDVPGLLELFRTVFGHEKSEAVWRWQFRDGLAGTHVHVGREVDGGRVVCHFGAVAARFWVRGQELVIAQVVDSAVHPDHAGGLRRRGLFAATGQCFAAWGELGNHAVAMGLPIPTALRIGRMLIGYVPMMKVHFLARAIEPKPRLPETEQLVRAKGEEFVVRLVPRFSADLDDLWLRRRDHVAAATPRDAAHMNWRYADCPEPRYHLLEMRRGEDLVGVAVGVVGYLQAPDGAIADWFVDPDVPGARDALLTAIESLMASVSMTRVILLMNLVDPEARLFEDRGYGLVPTHYTLVSRTYRPDVVTPDWLNRNWYYTMGDFDVV